MMKKVMMNSSNDRAKASAVAAASTGQIRKRHLAEDPPWRRSQVGRGLLERWIETIKGSLRHEQEVREDVDEVSDHDRLQRKLHVEPRVVHEQRNPDEQPGQA